VGETPGVDPLMSFPDWRCALWERACSR